MHFDVGYYGCSGMPPRLVNHIRKASGIHNSKIHMLAFLKTLAPCFCHAKATLVAH
jgi:hypothetical protein